MTWYDALAEELDLHGEDIDTDLLSCTATIDQLDSPYPTFRLWFTAWTQNRVYFTVSSASGTWIESCFRDPKPAHDVTVVEQAKVDAVDALVNWALDQIDNGISLPNLYRNLDDYRVERVTELRELQRQSRVAVT